MQTWQFLYFFFNKYIKFKNWTFWNQTFWNLTFVNLTFCKLDVLKPDILKPDVLKPDVLWVYPFYGLSGDSKSSFGCFRRISVWICYRSSPVILPDSKISTPPRGSQRDVVYLGWPIAPLYMSPHVEGVRGLRWSQPMSTAVHMEPMEI